MIKLCQLDQPWAKLRLLPSNLTVGRYGCTTCCICMISDYFECYRNPAQAIDTNIKYTKDGLVIWGSINFRNFKFEKKVFGWNTKEIDESIKNPSKAVILNVNYGEHWVVALRRIPFSTHYFIVDPLDGRIKTTKGYRNIVASSHFIKK